ncbi:vacuolar targeting protein [Suhomyces tanzawaensis NRRL Y-17324]|uniref:Vacuolar targeting protein n=1 Tax=Suhomyces tanzawaensis NRRL Y-17324 TaxID=984487 RepID=A0A1E4SN32_9ASCO|nr:vacuolar targeting protein [Suhomyces tanzawaensis NRRL Y-17324]ODV80905.1 vacuolar targeting protein [Suhomyces tanzawaensis NRRL Y-17324]
MAAELSQRQSVAPESQTEATALLAVSPNSEETINGPQQDDLEGDGSSKYGSIGYSDSPHVFTRRFWWFCSLGLAALIVLQLTFLPRTSLSRDYRRYHGIHLTKSEVKRNFLVFAGIGNSHGSLTTEQHILKWLQTFSKIHSESKINTLGSNNHKLTSFVESQFKQFGFKTHSYSYDVPLLKVPESLELTLVDSKSGRQLYIAKLLEPNSETPAFHSFGANGTIDSDYIYANSGDTEDYELLVKHGFEIAKKVVIVKTELNSNISIAEKVQIAQKFGASAFINYYDFESYEKANEKKLDWAISRSSLGMGSLLHFHTPKIVSIPVSLNALKPILDTFKETIKNDDFSDWDFHPLKSSNNLHLHLSTTFNGQSKGKATNIVGTLKGIINDGDIIIASKRDSLTSSNPSSGHAVLFEIMRNYQRLVKLGWKPLRNIKFISWDGSSDGMIGSQLFVNDTVAFDAKRPILSYINIDGDCIIGSKLHVDSNPFFNHILKLTSKFVPIPKGSTSYKNLPETETEGILRDLNIEDDTDDEEPFEDHDYEENYTTLHRYWMKQDNGTINNVLGQELKFSDAGIFQNHLVVPLINIRFDNDIKRESSVYIPNSNYYSLNWLTDRHIDTDLILHGLLIRYIGLLGINLSEHEVVDYKARSYFDFIRKLLDSFFGDNEQILDEWKNKQVGQYLLSKWSIFKDIQRSYPEVEDVRLKDLIAQIKLLVKDSYNDTIATDKYNKHVQSNLIKDYPWYSYYKKVGHFSQFKLANYKLLHWEKNLKLDTKDYQYLGVNESFYSNLLYGVPGFDIGKNSTYLNQRFKLSTFTGLRESVNEKDYELTVKWLVVLYDKLRNINWLL